MCLAFDEAMELNSPCCKSGRREACIRCHMHMHVHAGVLHRRCSVSLSMIFMAVYLSFLRTALVEMSGAGERSDPAKEHRELSDDRRYLFYSM